MTDGADEETVGKMSEGLQVELFHPESDREPGDTNIERWGFDVHPIVFPVALVVIALFIAATIGLGEDAATAYQWLFDFIGQNFGWLYLLGVNVFIIVLLYFALGKFGNIRIGGVEAEKEFSDFSWMAMLFSAGMGIGLMFFSVSEPLYYFQNVPGFFGAEAGTGAAAPAAM
jgi:choline/glycine/proline betaine transport protein